MAFRAVVVVGPGRTAGVRGSGFMLKMPVLTFRGDIRCSLGHRRSGQKRLGPAGLLPWT